LLGIPFSRTFSFTNYVFAGEAGIFKMHSHATRGFTKMIKESIRFIHNLKLI